MFAIFREERWVTVGMVIFFSVSILVKLLLGLLYQNMIHETDNMASTRNRLLKQCKVKFANCYQLNHGVANIPIFVDKFLNRLSFGPLSFELLYHLSGQSMLLSVICAGVGICRSIAQGRMLGEVLPFYIVSFAGLYIYFTVSTLVDVSSRKRVLKVNLVDYLENHLSARMEVTESDMEMLYGSRSNGNRRSRGSEKRTVELMPIRGRLALAAGEPGREEPEETERAPQQRGETEGVAWEGRKSQAERTTQINSEELEALLKELLTV